MIWFIIGIILFAITLYVHKHTYERKVVDEYRDRLPCPLWLVILAFIVACVPFLGIISFLVGMIGYLLSSTGSYPDVYFKAEGIVKKIKDLLTKEV